MRGVEFSGTVQTWTGKSDVGMIGSLCYLNLRTFACWTGSTMVTFEQIELVTRRLLPGCIPKHTGCFLLVIVIAVSTGRQSSHSIIVQVSLYRGGVWRLRTLSQLACEAVGEAHVCSVLILASCMHAGIRIVRIVRKLSKGMSQEPCTWEIDIIGAFTKGHESMCYGADSVSLRSLINHEAAYPAGTNPLMPSDDPDNDDDHPKDFVVVSTSFYDRKICAWSFHYDDTQIQK